MAQVFHKNMDGSLLVPESITLGSGRVIPYDACGQVRAKLSAIVVRKNGDIEDRGVLSIRTVTTAFLAIVTGCLRANTGSLSAIQSFNYHGCGTGTYANLAEAGSNTALYAEVHPYVDGGTGDRATGTQGGSGVTYSSSNATFTFADLASPISISEHGLFNSVEVSGGTLLDRSVFDGLSGREAAISISSGDSIIFSYTLTCSGS